MSDLDEWARWMSAGGMSIRTIRDRTQLVERIARITSQPPTEFTWQALAAFLATEHFSAGTRQTYYTHLRAWSRWLVLTARRVDDPTMMLRAPRSPRRVPRPVSLEQLTRLLTFARRRRARAMILLGAYEGFRVSEIARTRGDHICGDVIRVIGKGGVDADVPLHPLVAETAEMMPAGLWFPSYVRPGPVTSKAVSRTLSEIMRRAGVPGTPHALRHFFGTEALQSSGGNLVVTQQLLRHAEIATTVKYTKVDRAARVAAVLALPVAA